MLVTDWEYTATVSVCSGRKSAEMADIDVALAAERFVGSKDLSLEFIENAVIMFVGNGSKSSNIEVKP